MPAYRQAFLQRGCLVRTRTIALSALAIAFVGLSFTAAPVDAQLVAPNLVPPKPYTPPRTPDGQPDMQGYYSHVGLATGKEDNPAALCPEGGCYERNWMTEPSKGTLKLQVPMNVLDPADGRLPFQPWALTKKKEYQEFQGDPQKLEHVDTQTRCLHSGVPRTNWAIGYVGYQIIQGPGYVAFYTEYNHEFRMIPLDGRPHISPKVRLFSGDSVGRWEGNTLVVETTNIAVPKSTGLGYLDMQGSPYTDAVRVVERFTVLDADTIGLEVTVDDPKAYTKPWKTAGALVRGLKDYQVFEYACHEGNYGFQHIGSLILNKKK